jgi:hypothetical protein
MLAASVACAPAAAADLVISDALVWSDGLAGFAEFAAIRDARFIHVGRRDDRLVGPVTRRIDAAGRVVVPGLFDSHVHMLSGGQHLARLNLRDATSRADMARRVSEYAATLESGQWILGGRWSTESWQEPAEPTRQWVDAASGGRPLFLSRMDGHSALANTAALHLAGITAAGPPDPPGGVIARDPGTGDPTGILRESAMALVSRLIPEPGVAEKLAALRRAEEEALRHGITAVADIPDLDDLPAYEELARQGPRVRFFLYPAASDWTEAASRLRDFRGRPGWVEVRGLKAYLDGSLGSRTARMREPYQGDATGWRGLLREGVEEGSFARNVAAARDAGLQPIAHAIGDAANHLLLETLRGAYTDLRAARCRGEHAQHLLPEDVARFGALGVVASMQPYHKADDGRYAGRLIGEHRSRSSYAYKSLLDAGAVVVFGSDWPVVTIDPFAGIEAAVTGRIIGGSRWQTQENITVAEALRCYSSRGAWAAFAEDQIGRIAPGLRADFVILDPSPFAGPEGLAAVRPVAVYVEGKPALDHIPPMFRDDE